MGHLVYLSETLRFQVHVFMFMNKISMSQTAFLQDFYKDQSLQRSRAFGYIRESVDSLCRDGADAQYMQYLSKSRITTPQTRKKLI